MKFLFSLLLILGINQTFAQVNYLDKGMGSSDVTHLGANVMDWIGTNTIDEIWNYCDKNTKVDTNELNANSKLISDEFQYESGTEPNADIKETESAMGWYERTFYKQDKAGIHYLLQIKVGLKQTKDKQFITYVKFLKGAEIHSYNNEIKKSSAEDNEPKIAPARPSKKTDKEEDEED